jgi:hypothetical protein
VCKTRKQSEYNVNIAIEKAFVRIIKINGIISNKLLLIILIDILFKKNFIKLMHTKGK